MKTRKTRVRAAVSGDVRGASKVVSRQAWRALMAQRARRVHRRTPLQNGVVYHSGPSVLEPEEGILIIDTRKAGFQRPSYLG